MSNSLQRLNLVGVLIPLPYFIYSTRVMINFPHTENGRHCQRIIRAINTIPCLFKWLGFVI